jgi:hypothetical protein
MKISRRRFFLIIWLVSLILAGMLVADASGIPQYGWAVSFAILSVSLGVPLMRAMTEFSK